MYSPQVITGSALSNLQSPISTAMPAVLVALVLSFIPMWFYGYIVYWLDRFEREPLKLLIGVFLWGALVATIGAAVAEVIFSAGVLAATGNKSLSELANDAFFAPFVEESLKGIAILLVALAFRSEFDSVLDGIVYAGIVALGFAATEDVFYLVGGYEEQGWSMLLSLFVLRVILTGWNHAAFTAFTGIGIGLGRLTGNVPLKFLAPLAGWSVAVILHGTFNALLSAQNGLLAVLALCTSWLTWLGVFAIILWAISRDRARAKKFLLDEVQHGIMSPAQYRIATSALAPTFTRLGALGSGHFWDTRRFYQVCGELAQKKEQLEKYGEERGNATAVGKLRAELATLAPVART